MCVRRFVGGFLTQPVVTDTNSAAVASTSKTSYTHLTFLKCFYGRMVPCSQGHLVLDSFDTALLLPSGICKVMTKVENTGSLNPQVL